MSEVVAFLIYALAAMCAGLVVGVATDLVIDFLRLTVLRGGSDE